MPRMQTSRGYEFMGVNPPSFPSIPPHANAPLLSTTCHVARLDSASAICVPDVVVRVCRAFGPPWNLEVTDFHGVMVDVLCIMLTV